MAEPEKAYFCSTCNKGVDEKICPDCGNPTVEVKPQAAPRRPILLPSSSAASGNPAGAHPGPSAAPPPRPRPVSPPAPAPAPSTASASGKFAGEDELESYLAEGYEVFLIAGIGGAGKSELLASFRQDGFLDRFKKTGGMVASTIHRTLNCHPVSVGSRKVLFVDASGEDFRTLYPQMRQTGETTEADVSFLKVIARGLRGVILLIELERLWGNRNQDPADERQVEILSWILLLLRWMSFDGKYTAGPRRFQDAVDSSVMRMKKRLKIPVQVLFSKADQLVDFPVPQQLQTAAWLRKGNAPARKLYPVGEDPFLFAYHCLPTLYKAVHTHTDHFRFDFVHSLVTDPGSGMISDPNACGVKLALEWLLDPCWQSRWPILPARLWVDWQQRLDGMLGRSRRWQRLPDPVEVRS